MAIDGTAIGDALSSSSRHALEEQLSRLLAANHPALVRLAASYARSPSDRDDLMQEIAIALWRAFPTFRGECSERTFLFRVAHNRCITYISKKRPTVSLDEVDIDPEDPSPNAEAKIAEEQSRRALLLAIRSLPVIYREVIVLALEGMEYKDIAAVVGISDNNVGVRLNRARQLLKKLLEGRS